MSERDEARYQAYLDTHKSLVSGEERSADHFDKNILTLAAGAIAISLVFLEKIIQHPKASSLVYLYCSWVGLIVSLLATLISFLTSQAAYRRQREINDEVFFSDSSSASPTQDNRYSRATFVLNCISIFA